MRRVLSPQCGWIIVLLQYGLAAARSPFTGPHNTPIPNLPSRSSSLCPKPNLTAEQFAQVKFDYIIIGAGAGGLPLASRLTEDPSVVVGIIEAGVFHRDDPLVDIPGFSGRDVGNSSYDWSYATVPQANASGRVVQEPRGKMLGGSTGLNLLGWDRASKTEYDSWSLFSSNESLPSSPSALTRWDFENLLPYFKRVETADLAFFDTLPGLSRAEYLTAKRDLQNVDGSSGPVQASYNSVYGDLIAPYVTTWNSLDVPTNPDIFSGNTAGVRNERLSADRGVRSYAATAYYCPAASRMNLHVLTEAQVVKINFAAEASNKSLIASSASFVSLVNGGSGRGKKFIAEASKEIILSAGVVQTPQLLELSGIGDSSVLSPLGIKTLVDLPGVGTNLQDHIYVGSQFVASNSITTFDKLRYNQTFFEDQLALYMKNHTGFLTATDSALVFLPSNASVWPRSEISSLVAELERVLQDEKLTPLNRLQYQIQLDWLRQSNVPLTEIIAQSSGLADLANNTNYLSMLAGLMHPLSRGTIHISSPDPLTPPEIDPRYLSYDYDLQTLRVGNQITVAFAKQAPISTLLISQQLPPVNVTEKSDLESYVRSSFGTGDHLCGTAAMVDRALGGVVDTSLKVYGTTNLRVVDASIIPIIVGAHLQSTVYTISEKAADIIKRG